VTLSAQIASYVTNLKQAGQATKAFGGELQSLSEVSKAKFNDVARFGLIAGGALTAVAAGAVAAAYTFDKQMSEVGAVANATGKQLDQLRGAAIQAGKDTVFSATDAARAEAELAKAGVSAADIMGGALRGSLALASAGTIDLGDAATIAAQSMNIFGLRGNNVTHIADVLAAASNTSAANMHGLGDSLKQGGQQAAMMGLTLEQTVGVMSAFADNALVGSDGGTSFKTMLQSLAPTSTKTIDLMAKLGISFYDASGNFIGITKTAQVLKDKLGGLSEQERTTALNQIFGSDATRAANVLYKEGAAGIQTYIDSVNQNGAAADTAAQKMDNLAGDVEQLRGSLETLAITSSGGATGGLRILTEATTGLVNGLIDLPAPLTGTLTVLTGVAGVSLLAATGFVKARASGREFLSVLENMGPAGTKASTMLGKVGGMAGKAGLWGAAALVAYEGIHALFSYLSSRSAPATHDIDKLTDSMSRFATTGQLAGEFAKVAPKGIADMVRQLAAANRAADDLQSHRYLAPPPGMDAGTYRSRLEAQAYTASTKLNANFGDVDKSLTALVNNGQAAQALALFTEFSAAMRATGQSADEVAKTFPGYSAAANNAATANMNAAQSTTLLHTAQGTLIIGMDEAISKGAKLADIINSLSGVNEDAAKSTLAAEQALADLATQLKANDKAHVKNRKSLDEANQAGRDNLKLIFGAIDADKQQFQTTYAKLLQTESQTAALKDATDQYDAYIKRLRQTFVDEGFNAQQVEALLKLYAQIPPVASTQVLTPGLDPALSKAGALWTTLERLDGKTVKVGVYYTQHGSSKPGTIGINRWGGLYTHAAEGLLSQASMYSATSPGRYMIAEPGTGGEGFVPRYGNYARSTQIIDQEARWYGGRFVPNAGGGWGGGGANSSSTTNFYFQPQTAHVGLNEFAAYTAAYDAMQRVGRRA
jgi:TP901 family phage tail tape measure protein